MGRFALAIIVVAAGLSLALAAASGRAEAANKFTDWSLLGEDGGTYWYVPEIYLPAIEWMTVDPESYTSISDQTVWHINKFEDGYIFGPLAVKLETTQMVLCQFLIGSITPGGRVYITFNSLFDPPPGSPALTVGLGEMVKVRKAWTFNMQMSSGPAEVQIAHSAFMKQCTPDDDCWFDLPGVNAGVPEILSQCD